MGSLLNYNLLTDLLLSTLHNGEILKILENRFLLG